jgi:hypothetical protein
MESDAVSPLSPIAIKLDQLSIRPTSPARSTTSTASAAIDKDGLSWPAIGSKKRHLESEEEKSLRLQGMADSVTSLLKVFILDI